MEMLLHRNGDLQDSAVALIIDVCNMSEVSMEGSHKTKTECTYDKFYSS
jgi:hypothetical protein